MPTSPELEPGVLVWADLDPSRGREQAGRRPVLVVSGDAYLATIDTLAVVVPVTSVDRGWGNHILLAGLPQPSWAMTEQPRTVSRDRLHGTLGRASTAELADVRRWLADFLGLTPGS